MLIHVQPNNYTCMPAAFATATGIPYDTLIEELGHDGSDIIFPDLDEPLCRRLFVGQEFVLAMHRLGWLVVEVQREPFGFNDEDHVFTIQYDYAYFEDLLKHTCSVLAVTTKSTNNQHAVAWNGEQCYDPIGFIKPIDRYDIMVIYLLYKRNNQDTVDLPD